MTIALAAELAVVVRGQDRCIPEEARWLDEMAAANGYLAPTAIGNSRYCVMSRFAFTCAIITGHMFDDYGYSNRWCFDGLPLASRSLLEWESRGFEGEPIGWHRHPDSGRRRPGGDPAKEYINP